MQNYRLYGINLVRNILAAAVCSFLGIFLLQLRFIAIFCMMFFPRYKLFRCNANDRVVTEKFIRVSQENVWTFAPAVPKMFMRNAAGR
jgi:hypothetical protein